jgi:glycosyltransferase involved in cell wall biosynthesis
VLGEWQREYFEACYQFESKIEIQYVSISNRALVRNRWYSSGLVELCRSLSADVLHATFPIPLGRKGWNCKVVGTVHDLYAFDAPENFGYPNVWFNQAAFRVFLRSVERLSCVSDTTRKRLAERFPETGRLQPTVIFNAVPPPIDPEPPDWIIAGKPYFLCVAQHRRNKNLGRVIEAFARLGPGGRLLRIVGENGPETESLRRLVVRLGVRDSVEFRSGLTENELACLYRHALALVSPSLAEGFCLPAIEAAQYVCPTIVSDLPVFREIAADADVFVNPYSIESIACALGDFATLQPRVRRGAEAFGISALADQYQALYEAL